MKKAQLTLPELGLISGTRAIAGLGLGLLLADKLEKSNRKIVGWSLFLCGAATTIPLLVHVFGKCDKPQLKNAGE